MSFIPLDHTGPPSAAGRPGEAPDTQEVIPAKRVALTDILPLTLVGDQVRHVNKFIVGNIMFILIIQPIITSSLGTGFDS